MNNSMFSAILMALILFGAGMYMLEPLLRARAGGSFDDDYQETPLHHLLSRKDSIYTAMKDLEFDYKTGKLSDDDYEGLRDKFTEQAGKVLEEIDALTGKGKRGGKRGGARAADSVAEGDKCPDCGFTHKKGDAFCKSCGAALAKDETAKL